MTRKICLLVLCGIPASGKSTLAKSLCETLICTPFSENSNWSEIKTLLISYDHLISEEEEKQLVLSRSGSTKSQGSSEWKLQRNKILKCVDTYISHVINKQEVPQKPSDIDQELWDRFCSIVNSNSKLDFTSETLLVIIIDDNMYYSSMRYGFYQLARKYTIGFCQIYTKCDVETALERNKKRANRSIASEVIVTMATKLEPPGPDENNWERFSLVVEDSYSIDFQKITTLLKSAILEPVQPIRDEDTEKKEFCRKICSSNLVHQADQILRRLVGQKMAETKGKDMRNSEMKIQSNLLRDERTFILNGLRSGQILVTMEMEIMDSAKDEDCMFYRYIKELFEKRLSDHGVT